MSANLNAVRGALANPVEPPADDFDSGAFNPGGGGPDEGGVREMPDDCPVIPVGTAGGVYFFLTALGELRALKADQVANKHILGLFAPLTKYLEQEWPRRKLSPVTDQAGKTMKDDDGNVLTEWVTTGWDTEKVTMLLMDVAAQCGVWNPREQVRGRGSWIDDDGNLVLHSGNHVLIEGKWVKPGRYGGKVYPTAPAMPKPARLEGQTGGQLAPQLMSYLRSRGVEIADSAGPGVVMLETFRTWNWSRPDIDPWLLLGWNGAAILGGALDYRPLTWITGDKATGKSGLQKIIGWLHGPNGILQSPDATEAAVRQVLGQQSLPVGIDEAEADADNRKMLALIKLARLAASSQGNILRGGQDHEGHEFQATSCFLFSSILVPPMPPQDKSRLAVLELGEIPAGLRDPRFDRREIEALGEALRRRLVDRWQVWPKMLDAYRDALIDHGEHRGRSSDQFGTLLAAAQLMLFDDFPADDELRGWALRMKVSALSETADQPDNATLCLQHLGSVLVTLDKRNEQRLVSEWIFQAALPREPWAGSDLEVTDHRRAAEAALAKIGMRVVPVKDRPGREYLAVANNHQSLARLFEGTVWGGGVWAQALVRVDGAMRDQNRRIGKVQTKCTLVPVDQVVRLGNPYLDDQDQGAAARVGELV